MRALAIIPARGGSKRLPGKNIRPFLGEPLIHWSIKFARRLGLFDKVVVSTDSDEIADCCGRAGLEVFDRRPKALASDEARSVDVVLDVLAGEEARGSVVDLVALLQPTSPLREAMRWREAFALIEQGGCDAVVGVSPAHTHPFHAFKQGMDGALESWIDKAGLDLRTQDLPPAVSVNGSLYLIRAATLKVEKTFFPIAVKGVLCDQPYEAHDIDTEADWIVAEAMALHFGRQP